ncbi:hypothetical protein CPR19088_GLDEOEPO_00233 [Companilactobacillus paralimentarius]
MRRLRNDLNSHLWKLILLDSIAAIALVELIASLSIPINLILMILMLLMTYTGFQMISTGKTESFVNKFTGITIAMGIAMVILFLVG